MADNYALFSFAIKKLTPKETDWLKNLMALDFEDERQRKEIEETLGIPMAIQSSIEYWPDFSYSLSDLDKALWVYTEDSGNAWNAALLVRAFLAKFRPRDIRQFGVAYTCSKPRLDEFAGETYVVTDRNIYSDACVAGMVSKAIKTGRLQKTAYKELDIIVRPKKGRQPCPR
jgi:hypothetical protein